MQLQKSLEPYQNIPNSTKNITKTFQKIPKFVVVQHIE